MAELKLAGITLKRPKMLRKHNILRQGDKARNSDVFLLLFLTLHNDRLNLSTNPHNISVMQQRFSFVSLRYLWSLLHAILVRFLLLCDMQSRARVSGFEYGP